MSDPQLERWGGSAVPRWGTPRDFTAPTFGPSVAGVARSLGRAFMPWQAGVADVMGEVVVDRDGRPLRMAYPVVVLLVPRRGGKTLLTLATSLQRAAAGVDRRVWYTAQTGSDAARTFRDEWVPLVRRSSLAPYFRVRLSNGSQGFTLPADLGSAVGVFAPTETALHGQDGDHITVDEAWAHDADAGAALEAALRPTQLTRPLRQLVIISAGGTDASTYLLRYRKLGRELVEAGGCRDAGLALFEWHPGDDDDLDDPAVWARTHPAVGHTISLDVLRADHATMEPDAFQRGILNRFTSSAGARVVPLEAWQACQTGDRLELPARGLTFGYDVSLDRTHGAIVAAWRLPDGTRYGELVDYRPSPSSWMVDRLLELRRRYRAQLRADSAGPVTGITAGLVARGVRVETLTAGEYATACGMALDDVVERRLRLWTSRQLDDAAASAATRQLGDGFAWTRRKSGGDVCPLVALTVALPAARVEPTAPAAARVRFAS